MKLPFEEIEKDIIIKKGAITDPNLGEDPNNRTIQKLIQYGIVNIDKPKGPTSHQVSDYVQKILNISKSGHSGTLDPAVTGVLPIALGKATRIVQTLLPAGKEYVCIMHVHREISENKIKKVFRNYQGTIMQLPPIKSAIKRQLRKRTIYYLEILEIDGKDILFRVGCEAGTYIRKLVHDMGKSLNAGAHMAELRRTKAGCFDESTLYTLNELADAYHYYKNGNEKFLRKIIQPIENAVTHLQKVWVNDTAVKAVVHGRDLAIPGISKLHNSINPEDMIAVMTLKNELIAIGTAKETSVKITEKNKGIAVEINKVFMEESLY